MARVKSFSVAGIELWFHSGDHAPPHFHAKQKGEWEARIHFLFEPSDMVEMKWNEKKRPPQILKKICLLAEQHREELLDQWERVHQVHQ